MDLHFLSIDQHRTFKFYFGHVDTNVDHPTKDFHVKNKAFSNAIVVLI